MNIAIVTGASSGMGREFVLQLSGHVQVDEIWAVARRAANLEALKEETPIPVRSVVLDLLQKESFAAFGQLLEAEKPNVKLLVNAAGFGKFGSFDKVSVEDDCRMIDLNCKALVVMTRLTLPYMAAGSHSCLVGFREVFLGHGQHFKGTLVHILHKLHIKGSFPCGSIGCPDAVDHLFVAV